MHSWWLSWQLGLAMIYCDIDFNGKDVVAILSKIKSLFLY